jgi:hypothetical protein
MAFRIKDRCFAYVEPIRYLAIASYGLIDLVCPPNLGLWVNMLRFPNRFNPNGLTQPQ